MTMTPLLPLLLSCLLLLASLMIAVSAQSESSDGYSGYSLSSSGGDSTVYATDDTPANVSVTSPAPDVYLHALVHVTQIDLTVDNLTAKVSLDAAVLSLLQFNAGVDVSIQSVQLTIDQVNAEVYLEARLENLVLMIDDVLDSIDLNPIIVTLGSDVSNIVNTTLTDVTDSTDLVTSEATTLQSASLQSQPTDVLYSVNDFSGSAYMNRILAQNGSIIDQYLNRQGQVSRSAVVGYYLRDMTWNGVNISVTYDGFSGVRDEQYVYQPYVGLSAVCEIYLRDGQVIGTTVLSESGAGADATVDGGGS